MSVTWAPGEKERFARFWLDIGNIGEIGPRESRIVASAARQGIALNFEREQSPDGHPWVPLCRRTVEERRRGIDQRGIPFRVGGHHPILQRTGDLKRSFVDPAHPRNVTKTEHGGGVTVIILSATDDPRTPGRIATLNSGGLTMSNAVVLPRPFIGLGATAAQQLDQQVERVIWQRIERL